MDSRASKRLMLQQRTMMGVLKGKKTDSEEVLEESVVGSNMESSIDMSVDVPVRWHDQMVGQFWMWAFTIHSKVHYFVVDKLRSTHTEMVQAVLFLFNFIFLDLTNFSCSK